MKDARLLHVSCMVRDSGGLWHLLRGLEAHGVHNVKVEPVSPDSEAVIEAQAALEGRPRTAQRHLGQDVPHVRAELVAREPKPKPKRRRTAAMHSRARDELSRSMIIAHLDHQEGRTPADVALRVGMPVKTVNNRLWHMVKEGSVARPEFGLYILLRRPAGARS